MNLQTFIQLVQASTTLSSEQKIQYLSAAPLYAPEMLDAIAAQLGLGVEPTQIATQPAPLASSMAQPIASDPVNVAPIVEAAIPSSDEVTPVMTPTPEQVARIAALDKEIADKKQQLELIENLFRAMRENAEEEDEATITAELTDLEAQIAAL